MSLRVLIAGGGTGGHLFPALAIAETLRDKGVEAMFVGTKSGLEAKIVPQKGFSLKFIWLSGFNRKKLFSNLLFPFKVVFSAFQSFRILSKYRPLAALGTGGYVCGPILLAAALKGIPIFLQEQNSYPGVTTRLLARFAKEIYLNFEEASAHLPSKAKWRHVGNPVRPGFTKMDRATVIRMWELNPSLPTLLVFGGSQGALSINRAVNDILPSLGKRCNLIWSRGYLDKSDLSAWQGPGVLVVREFIDDMPAAYAAADLAVCRSGAMTLSELQAAALPAILIPYPYAAADHQKHNALAFCRNGGAMMIENKDLNGDRFLSEVSSLLHNKAELERMSSALAEIEIPDTAAIIAAELIKTAQDAANPV